MTKSQLAKRGLTLAWSIGLGVVLLGMTTAVILPSTKSARHLAPSRQSEDGGNSHETDFANGAVLESNAETFSQPHGREVVPERVVPTSQDEMRPVLSSSKSVVAEVPIPWATEYAEQAFEMPEELNTDILEMEPEDPFDTDLEVVPENAAPELSAPFLLPGSKSSDFIEAGEAMISSGKGGDE